MDKTYYQMSIDKIGVFVSDYALSVNFYKNILGLTEVWSSMDDGNAAFRSGYNLLVVQVTKNIFSRGGIRPYLTVKNLDKIKARLSEYNIKMGEIQSSQDFRLLDFEDPDGNWLGLMEIAEDYIPQLESYLGRKFDLENRMK